MVVRHLSNCSKSALSALNTIFSEGIFVGQNVFANGCSLWENSELTLWKVKSEDTKSVCNRLLDEFRVFSCFCLANLKELLGQFVYHLVVLFNVSVFHIVAEETECIE